MISNFPVALLLLVMFNFSRHFTVGFQLARIHQKSLLIRRDHLNAKKKLEIGQTIKFVRQLTLGGIGIGTILSKPKRGEWKVEVQDPNGQLTNQIIKTSDIIISNELVSPNSNLIISPSTSSITKTTDNSPPIKTTTSSSHSPDSIPTSSKETSIAHIIPPEAHAKCRRWIIFSDLHVKGSSMETCEKVLKEVHAVALQKDAGIIFLGDFWHVRGSLSVELLNRVLRSLQLWTQPVIMIPGK